MLRFSVVVGFALFLFVSARSSVSSSPYPVPSFLRKTWVKRERIAADAKLELTLYVRNSNLDVLREKFLTCSDPDSPLFGFFFFFFFFFSQYWTKEELCDVIRPSQLDLLKVDRFLEAFGFEKHEISPCSDVIKVSVSSRDAERAFKTEIYNFEGFSSFTKPFFFSFFFFFFFFRQLQGVSCFYPSC